MPSLLPLSSFSISSLRTLHSSSLLFLSSSFASNCCGLSPPRGLRIYRASSAASGTLNSGETYPSQVRRRANNAGVKLEETVDIKSAKLRLDFWISSRIQGVSRARVQSSIRSGLVSVNGRVVDKVSHSVKSGDLVACTISELQPLKAEPEDISLDIVFEDEHVLVVNKPAHMVVHPAPGNPNGTLVNGILHHCSLPTVACLDFEDQSDAEDTSDDKELVSYSCNSLVRPGIVHRLDKGTSGLLVVAKNEYSHAFLSEQFKLHTIERVYISVTSGVPSPCSGRIEVPIGRDLNNRIRMAAIPGSSGGRYARHAASRYKALEILAGGGFALVEWRLETGRTHQIRAHAKYAGVPLLGDEVYGGTKSMALSLLRARTSSKSKEQFSQLVSRLERPCLHAMALGFKHPHSGEDMQFACPPPSDFAEILSQLRRIGTSKSVKTVAKNLDQAERQLRGISSAKVGSG